MPSPKKTPVKQDFEDNRYKFGTNIELDLEPFKEYIGKMPAYEIAVKIEEKIIFLIGTNKIIRHKHKFYK